ncbi:MAG: hypothetical protein ABIR39_07705 [Nocardioides sp.]|uniref:hypothetical protein n=1 Tax=Nocardioides sp. TaxID=35761 RepID=UPI003266DAAB
MRCLSVLLSTSLVLAAAASAVPTQAAVSDDRPSVKTVSRAYGAGVVRQNDRDQRLRINFRGKQGDLVTLVSSPVSGDPGCERTELWRVDNDRRVQQKVAALWRLPRSGRFTITYRQDCYLSPGMDEPGNGEYLASVQLTKVVPHPLAPGGAPVDLPRERGYLHAAVLTLPDTRAVGVTAASGDFERLLVAPSMEARRGPGDTFDSSTCVSYSPVVVQAGWGIAHNPPSINGGTVLTQIACEEEVAGHVPGVGESVWFLNPRRATVATAAYAE